MDFQQSWHIRAVISSVLPETVWITRTAERPAPDFLIGVTASG